MNRSENIGQLAAALAAAQAKFRPVMKDRNASIQSKTGGSFRYSYADLATVVAAVREALSANGLAVLQPVRSGDGEVVVTSLLAHASGEWISEEMRWPVVTSDNRSIGSGITYARRHSLLALTGAAATDEDDDAQEARGGDHDTASVPATRPTAVKSPTISDRKAALTAKLHSFGMADAGVKAWVDRVLGHPFNGQTTDDIQALENEVSLLEVERKSMKS